MHRDGNAVLRSNTRHSLQMETTAWSVPWRTWWAVPSKMRSLSPPAQRSFTAPGSGKAAKYASMRVHIKTTVPHPGREPCRRLGGGRHTGPDPAPDRTLRSGNPKAAELPADRLTGVDGRGRMGQDLRGLSKASARTRTMKSSPEPSSKSTHTQRPVTETIRRTAFAYQISVDPARHFPSGAAIIAQDVEAHSFCFFSSHRR